MNALAKKLFIKPGTRWLFYNAPEDYLTLLSPLPDGVKTHFEIGERFDGIQIFTLNSDELNESISIVAPLISNETIAWVTYPKKSSGIKSDLAMMGDWSAITKHNLEGVAAASVNDTWTAIRIRPIGMAKKSNTANAEIKQNDYSAYIDVDNKLVHLPADVEEALKAAPGTLEYYNSLAYSHRKEYVLWIVTAKQEKTRADRMVKMVEMLSKKKKNPTEK